MSSLLSIEHWPVGLWALTPLIGIALLLCLTRIYTTLIYHTSLHKFTKENITGGHQILTPAQIPYALPWLGHALAFLTTSPGRFWDQLAASYPTTAGICTLLIAGRRTHIITVPTAVQALFRAKAPSRVEFEREMFSKVFIMPPDQVERALQGKAVEHEVNSRYLTNFERVNELTAQFTKFLEESLERSVRGYGADPAPEGLYAWLRDRMFEASVTALMGERLLEMYPTFRQDFYMFESSFSAYLFDTPNVFLRSENANRERIFQQMQKWSEAMLAASGGSPVDPDGPAWEPLFGSRLNRARQNGYKDSGFNKRTGAALDLGITFGLASNAIPATGWMLFHVLDPAVASTVLPAVLAEIDDSLKEDGTIDVPRLMAQPLLQSIWTETLRLYADVLVVRALPEETLLPIDEDGKKLVRLQKGDAVFAPTWASHRNSTSWSSAAPVDTFDAYRFVTVDPKTNESVFALGKVGGRFFPFGGGKTICPGRTFAKQETIGALAQILLSFSFDVVGYLDQDKKSCDKFPVIGKAYPGSGTLTPGGDILVKIKRRSKK